MLNNDPLFYFNHLILFAIWTWFHVLFLKCNKSRKLTACILYFVLIINFVLNMLLFAVFYSFFSVSFYRTLVTIVFLYIILKMIIKDTAVNTFFSVLFHLVVIVSSEIMAILITLAISGFNQQTFENETFFGLNGFLLMDLFNVIFFGIILHFKYKALKKVNWKQQIWVLPLIVIQFLWIYILSYYLIYKYEIHFNLTYLVIISLFLMHLTSFVLIKKNINYQFRKRQVEFEGHIHDSIYEQISALNQKQNILETVYYRIKENIDSLNYNDIIAMKQEISTIRNTLYCDLPSVNAMLCHFENLCKQNKISYTFSINASLISVMSDYDLNTVLSNLLQNAFEATINSDNPFIKLDILQKNQLILIRCENCYNQNKKNSTKLIQGNGLKIIEGIVEVRNGTLEKTFKKERFIIEILISN